MFVPVHTLHIRKWQVENFEGSSSSVGVEGLVMLKVRKAPYCTAAAPLARTGLGRWGSAQADVQQLAAQPAPSPGGAGQRALSLLCLC